jgi:hypothetical protein
MSMKNSSDIIGTFENRVLGMMFGAKRQKIGVRDSVTGIMT